MTLDEAAAWYAWYKRHGHRGLREIALRAWDPIGIGSSADAGDEYDAYLGLIANRLRHGVTVDELAPLLTTIRIERMGLPDGDEADRAASQAFIAWYERHAPDARTP